MRSRRFLLLAAVLVTVNAALWLASGALGLSQISPATLFGRNMARVDVTDCSGSPTTCAEWRLARGTVVSNKLGVLTLQEADTKTEAINVSSSTKVTVLPGTKAVKINGIKAGWRVLATWPISDGVAGTAVSVAVEKRKSQG
jgi:hypothetical protein